jgi:hypothetical protein
MFLLQCLRKHFLAKFHTVGEITGLPLASSCSFGHKPAPSLGLGSGLVEPRLARLPCSTVFR